MKRPCKQGLAQGINWLLVALLSITFVLTACTPGEQTPTRYIVDDLGRPVAINGTPQRIISLAPSTTEILFALGLADKVVGVTDYCDWPPEALSKEKIGGLVNPNIEKVVFLNPDLILASDVTPIKVISDLEGRLRLTVFGLKSTDLDDLLNDIRTVGKITNREAEAEALITDMQSRIKAVTDKIAGLPPEEKPRTFHICWHDPIFTAGNGTYINDLIEKTGGVNTFADREGYQSVNIETVIARDPEVIIVTAMGGTASGTWEWVTSAPELKNVLAYKNERIYFVESNWVERPGPRVVLGLEALAKCIHPEIFGIPEEVIK